MNSSLMDLRLVTNFEGTLHAGNAGKFLFV
jgi:hypothetical protein